MNYQPGVIEEQPYRVLNPLWTEAEDATLKRMWDEGKAASAVGIALGRSRNAVIGRVHRLGMQKRGADWIRPVRASKPEKPPVLKLKTVKKPSAPKPKAYVPAPNEPAPLNVRVFDIPDNGCHWPVNDGGTFIFCGHERNGNPTYCAHHASRTTTTQIPWGQK